MSNASEDVLAPIPKVSLLQTLSRALFSGRGERVDMRPPGILLAALGVVGLLYVPQLDELMLFLGAPQQFEATHTLQPSFRFFYEVVSRCLPPTRYLS